MAENAPNYFPNYNQEVPGFSTMLFQLAKSGFILVLRFNIMLLLLAYNTACDLLRRMLVPFEPIAVEVRKVPKKDVSLEGVFYQFLRLQFLVALLVWPLVKSATNFMAKPLVWLKDWMIDFVREPPVAPGRSDPSVLKEG